MAKIVGILGGMGPLSTVELMRKVIQSTPAKKEQEHIRMLVDNRPQIPDRTANILGKGESPLPFLIESAQLLEKWGADVIAIPCNTAHYFIKGIQQALQIPALDMIDLLHAELKLFYTPGAALGLLATSGALQSGLFHRYLADYHLATPPEKLQETGVMKAIYEAKTGKNLPENREALLKIADSLTPANIECLIAGCTEIGMILDEAVYKIPIINPLDGLAKKIVDFAFSV